MKKLNFRKLLLFYGSFVLIITSGMVYQGCSELDNSVTLAPEIRTHLVGWSNPSSANFHGIYIRTNNWNLSGCKTCHGGDYSGGTSGASCLGCHNGSGGPESCNLCHGNSQHIYPPKSLNNDSLETDRGVGVHDHHLNPNTNVRYSAQVRCVSCHKTVNSFSDPVHIQNTNNTATIFFDSLALNVLPGDTIVPNPVYDPVTNKCSNVYCHGNFKNGNRGFEPVFNNPESVVCGSCHGNATTGNPTPGTNGNILPPHYSFMTSQTCYICHGSVINSQGQIFNQNLHLNGVINY
ncbi:MAG: CxxxxCH/CxxCH domain-containing protein [Ignavibacteria bacterium]|nr:CxxxxCH/CxxCH domain-containing protein [Ignavibacteria bacterium]